MAGVIVYEYGGQPPLAVSVPVASQQVLQVADVVVTESVRH